MFRKVSAHLTHVCARHLQHLFCLFSTGCSDDDGDSQDTDVATTGGTTGNGDPQVRVLHGSPDAPAVDIYVEGSATP